MMNRHQRSHFYLARLTLENRTALSIVSGMPSGTFDTELMRDANDLPCLPGSAVAGVLRHLHQREYGSEATEQLFGMQRGDQGIASRLQVSWGVMLDSQGKAREGLDLGEEIKQDPLLDYARGSMDKPTFRDRVRLNHRGTAAEAGKFDRAVLPAGFRFALEVSMWSVDDAEEQWLRLLGLFNHPLFRLGGNTRAGLGKMSLISLHQRHFDLSLAQDAEAFRQLPHAIDQRSELENLSAKQPVFPSVITARIQLQPSYFWRAGQGDRSLLPAAQKAPDLLPKLEPRIRWKQREGEGELHNQTLLLAGSGVKGALSHRIAYHHNLSQGFFSDQIDADELEHYQHSNNEAVRELFGHIDAQQGGQAGVIYIDDFHAALDNTEVARMMHTAIDRFTGGVRHGMLFEEELLWQVPITLDLSIDTSKLVSAGARNALMSALDELCQAQLALGAGASKGHGFFTGDIEWSDKGAWITGKDLQGDAA